MWVSSLLHLVNSRAHLYYYLRITGIAPNSLDFPAVKKNQPAAKKNSAACLSLHPSAASAYGA
jgi:hypothetical protein